jgi:hypothetical protein
MDARFIGIVDEAAPHCIKRHHRRIRLPFPLIYQWVRIELCRPPAEGLAPTRSTAVTYLCGYDPSGQAGDSVGWQSCANV